MPVHRQNEAADDDARRDQGRDRVLPDDAPLISVSDHLFEVPEMFAGVLPANHADDAPHVVDLGGGAGEAWVFGDVVLPVSRMPLVLDEGASEPGHASRIADVPDALRTPEGRLSVMD